MHKEPFRFFHDFILSHRFSEEQEKIEKNEGRKEKQNLELERVSKIDISEEKNHSTRCHPEHQSPLRVSTERIPVISGTLFQKTEFREPFGDHQEVAESPPAQQNGEGWPDFQRCESEPSDQKTDGIVGGFGYGIEKRDVLCPDRFDIVYKSCDKKRQQRIE